jgi:NitT/TauT family transport system substrate-binding protein
MHHCLRIQLSIVTSALLLIIGCGRQNHSAGPVRIALTGRSSLYLPLFVAGPAGCFDQQGIRVELAETAGATKSMEALIGGSVDVAATDYFGLLNVAMKGQSVRGFLLMQKIPGFAAIVSPKASKPIRTIEDLRGRTVGVATVGSGYHRVLNRILLLHGVKPEEVSVVGVGNGLSLALAMERGMVDLGLASDLTIGYLDRRFPDLTFLFDTRTAAATKAALGAEEMAFLALCARTGWLDAQPQTASKVAAATQCAIRWVQDHTPQQIREKLPQANLSSDAEADYEWIANQKRASSTDGRMTPEAHAAAVRVLFPEGSARLNEQEVFTNEFIKQ